MDKTKTAHREHDLPMEGLDPTPALPQSKAVLTKPPVRPSRVEHLRAAMERVESDHAEAFGRLA